MFVDEKLVLNLHESEGKLTIRVAADTIEAATAIAGEHIEVVDGVGNAAYIFNGYTRVHKITMHPGDGAYELELLKVDDTVARLEAENTALRELAEKLQADLDFVAIMAGVTL